MTAVHLFVTCVGEMVVPDVPVAAVRVLRAAGCSVDVPVGQTCCGQPAWNAGFTEQAAEVARTSLDALDAPLADDPDAVVVVPAGSCTTMIRLYWPQLFELVGDDERAARAREVAARTFELTEFLEGRELPTVDGAATTVALHESCHLLRELHVETGPGAALARVAGCTRVDWSADDRCCGFGGTFSVKLPETSVAMADEKLDTLPDGVEVIVGADSSCLLHLRTRAEHRGLAVTTRHVAEVLDDAIRAEDGSEKGDGRG
ncbi:MAG: (Fe-S)-binding protein [Acidimicrobiales bacterium]|nr:(Fe-S)-binding protein [Acidimicrobiales bacterium]